MSSSVFGILTHFFFKTTFFSFRFGFIPNGGRVYYSKRSQPPMLISMVYNFYQETSDKDFLHELLPSLEAELSFWTNNRSINVTANGKNYQLYQYNTRTNVPRPESYFVDFQAAKNLSKRIIQFTKICLNFIYIYFPIFAHFLQLRNKFSIATSRQRPKVVGISAVVGSLMG